jgi:hypothetical protein
MGTVWVHIVHPEYTHVLHTQHKVPSKPKIFCRLLNALALPTFKAGAYVSFKDNKAKHDENASAYHVLTLLALLRFGEIKTATISNTAVLQPLGSTPVVAKTILDELGMFNYTSEDQKVLHVTGSKESIPPGEAPSTCPDIQVLLFYEVERMKAFPLFTEIPTDMPKSLFYMINWFTRTAKGDVEMRQRLVSGEYASLFLNDLLWIVSLVYTPNGLLFAKWSERLIGQAAILERNLSTSALEKATSKKLKPLKNEVVKEGDADVFKQYMQVASVERRTKALVNVQLLPVITDVKPKTIKTFTLNKASNDFCAHELAKITDWMIESEKPVQSKVREYTASFNDLIAAVSGMTALPNAAGLVFCSVML